MKPFDDLPSPHETIGCCTLVNADCMDILPLLPENSFDLALVDPPYGGGAQLPQLQKHQPGLVISSTDTGN
jgi:DNA modification methylase